MSSETARNVVTYTPLESGNEESRWIRLEQVQAVLPGPSVSEAAYLIDLLYNAESCDDGMGGGGAAADDEKGPSADEVDKKLSILLQEAGQCREAGYWLAAINVYRTHEQPGYELRSETAKVQKIEQVTESYRQEVDVNGPLIALDRPYAGNLHGIPAGVNWEVRGGTVNLDRPVHDRLILRYDTRHEYVTLRVPTKKTDDGEEYEPAAVVAFWGDMAAECVLEPPEPEDEEEQEEIDDLCRKLRPEPQEPGDCWKRLRHYSLCECSKRRVLEWEEEESAPCDGRSSGSFVGHEDRFDGYVVSAEHCDDSDEELQDPAFYRDHCCTSPPDGKPLPRCRRSYAVYAGGHEIDSGPDHWKNLYGENVVMRPVLPKSGKCGELITEWRVPQKNCCDGITPLAPSENNPEEIWPGGEYMISVLYGKQGAELNWRASGGIVFRETGSPSYRTPSRTVWIRALENICPHPTITVDDGCDPLVMAFTGPQGEGVKLSSNDVAVTRGQRFTLAAGGGVPGYMWQVSGGIKLLGWSPDGATAYLEAPEDDGWCMGEVTVVDQCGSDDTATIRNATGGWYLVSGGGDAWDKPPCPPYKLIGDGTGRTHPKCGTYIVARTYMGGESGGTEGFPSCRRGEWYVGGVNVIDQEIIISNGVAWADSCAGSGGQYVSSGCCHIKDGRYYYSNWYTNVAWEVYEWRC